MSSLQIETHEHQIEAAGFRDDCSVVITFDNGPLDGEIVITAEKFQKLYDQWKSFCANRSQPHDR